jgi:UDP-2,3-diacylglucosamine hydrolase
VVLFVSDIHFGRFDAPDERAKEAALLDCLRAHADAVDHLYLVGDVFDQYIEYDHLVPKGFVRFQGLLADWTDRGVPVTYLVGNHDPWHRDYFQRELGVRLVYDALIERHHGQTVHLTHGDHVASHSRLYPYLRTWLRHPVPVWVYRTVLPGDSGYGLARWVNRRTRKSDPEPRVVEALRDRARRLLETTPADVAVMGHTHHAELTTWTEAGTYLNTGDWYDRRTFGVLDADGVHLHRWNGSQAQPIESTAL